MTTPESTDWISQPPKRPGVYQWRAHADREAHRVMVGHSCSATNKIETTWLCYSITDFTEMDAGGEWRYQGEYITGALPAHYVQGRMAVPSGWTDKVPHKSGRYFWRADKQAAPCLVHVHEPLGLSDGTEREGILLSYAHVTEEEFQTLKSTGHWLPVGTDLWWS